MYIDALVLNDDGNVLDALSLACYAALANTRVPKVEIVAGENGEEPELELDDDVDSCIPLELQGLPIITSVSQVSYMDLLNLSRVQTNARRLYWSIST